MRLRILGKIWNLVWVPKGQSVVARGRGKKKKAKTMNSTDKGTIEAPNIKGKRIFIREELKEKDELDTVLHECLHAADWWKDEEWVDEVAEDIARILWRLGWRKQQEEEE